jgi:predicted nucleic acid-binding protein
MKLVDSDIVIDHFHGSRLALEYFAQTLAAGETLSISVITVTEILSGMREL